MGHRGTRGYNKTILIWNALRLGVVESGEKLNQYKIGGQCLKEFLSMPSWWTGMAIGLSPRVPFIFCPALLLKIIHSYIIPRLVLISFYTCLLVKWYHVFRLWLYYYSLYNILHASCFLWHFPEPAVILNPRSYQYHHSPQFPFFTCSPSRAYISYLAFLFLFFFPDIPYCLNPPIFFFFFFSFFSFSSSTFFSSPMSQRFSTWQLTK